METYSEPQHSEQTFRMLWNQDSIVKAGEKFGDGIRLRDYPRNEALTHTYIRCNSEEWVNVMVFDLDDPDAATIVEQLIEAGVLPPSTSYLINPETGHAHIFIFFKRITKALWNEYGRDLAVSIRDEIGADKGFIIYTFRNPLLHPTVWGRGEPLTFTELTAYAGKMPEKHTNGSLTGGDPKWDADTLPHDLTLIEEGMRDNCLWDNTRHWVYQNYLPYRGKSDEEFMEAATQFSLAQNKLFPDPLPESQAEQKAFSAVTWAWREFPGNTRNLQLKNWSLEGKSPEEVSIIQSLRSNRTEHVKAAPSRHAKVLAIINDVHAAGGSSREENKQIMEAFNLDREAAKGLKRRALAKKAEQDTMYATSEETPW